MAITRSQQAKQMLQDGGMLVKPSTDGKRPGYRSARAQEIQGRTTKSQGISPGQAAAMFGTDKASTYAGMDKGAAEATIRSEVARQRNIKDLKDFKETKPPVKFPKFTPSGFIAETFFKKPLQKFSDFTTAKNRAFFENVIRAGKIPGVTFADLQNPNFDLEEEYQEYMANRMAGKIDAYGNPVEGFSYDSKGNLVGNFRGDGPDPIPFIPPVVSQPEKQVTGYVNPLSLLTPRIVGTQFAADGGRIGFFLGGNYNQTQEQKERDINISRREADRGGGNGGPKTTPIVNPVSSNEPAVNPIFRKTLREPELQLEAFIKKMELENRMKEEEDDEENMAGGILADTIRNVPELKQRISTINDAIKSADLNFAGGGIASLDREAFLLGGIAKGLKKAVRGVKKLVKSPIGKAALLAAPFVMSGGLGSIFGSKLSPGFMGGKAPGFLNMLKRGIGYAKDNPFKVIGGLSLLSGLMTSKQDDDKFDLASYYAQNQLEPSQSIRGMGSEFDFYGGQRMRVADGGDVEPVAKKTMPLLDMGGKEKDYRETGGFVDMGRMERADDVPARLSKNEFVFTADAVRNAGEGDIDKGAEVMYNMMKNLEAGGEVSEESQGLEGARKMFQTSQRLGEVI